MGKPRMAIKVPLLDAFEAILDIIVKLAENPSAPTNKLTKKRDRSSTGFPRRMIYIKNPTTTRKVIRSVLNRILEIIMDCGFAMV